MDKITIVGNNHDKELISFYDLRPKDQKEMTGIYGKDAQYGLQYFYYRRQCYCLSEFTRYRSELPFDVVHHDSFFSGIGIKLNDDETIKVFTFYG